MRYAPPGQAVGEYGIAIALVAITGIAALSLFGQNLQDIFMGYGNPLATHQSASTTTVSTTLADKKVDNKAQPSSIETDGPILNGTEGLSLTLANGQIITLPNYPNNLQSAVETNGANGTTDILASQLSLLASKLLESGNITEEQANQLKDLSNQGHAIASIESTIGNILHVNNNSETPQTINLLKFPLNGKSYSAGSIANLIGQPRDSNNQLIDGVEIQKLKQLLSNAQSTGALNDPAVSQLVSSLTQNIQDIANKTEMAIDASNEKQVLPDKHNFIVASQATRNHSNTICSTGGRSEVCAK